MGNSSGFVARSVRTAYAASVIGLTLVLFVLGIGTWGIFKAQDFKKTWVEQTTMNVFFNGQVNEADQIRLEKDIKGMPFVLRADKISEEEAYEIAKAELGQDEAEEFLEGFPIPPSIQIWIKEDYVSVDSLDKYQAYIEKNYSDIVREAYYDKTIVKNLEAKTKTPLLIIISLAALLLLVAIALIYNTIRLAIYSKRFSIRTMTLVGANTSFIRRPFLVSATIQGLLSGIFAVSLLVAVFYMLKRLGFVHYSDLELIDRTTFIYIFGTLMVFGVTISFGSTWFALRKYIRIKADQLY